MAHSLVIMAAGLGTRFGGDKQLEPLGPSGELLLDYAMHDAARSGFGRVVIVVRPALLPVLHEHVDRLALGDVPVQFVVQEGAGAPVRARPWGTAHAVLAAARQIEGGFSVCNADDWYGREAFALAARHLTEQDRRPAAIPLHAIIGYRLDRTLSGNGGVARGIAEVDANGQLLDLVEARDIVRGKDGIRGTVDGTQRPLRGDEPVSMNLWAFERRLGTVLQAQFEDFLAAHAGSGDAEFPLSTAIGEQVRAGQAAVTIIPTNEQWMGVTWRDDAEDVRAAIARLVEEGAYPRSLFRD